MNLAELKMNYVGGKHTSFAILLTKDDLFCSNIMRWSQVPSKYHLPRLM